MDGRSPESGHADVRFPDILKNLAHGKQRVRSGVLPRMNSKLLLSFALAAGLAATARAEVFGPETSRNVLLGGIVGAIIGENNHHEAVAGAAIGAAAGYIWSEATGADGQACRPAPATRTVSVARPVEPACEPVEVVRVARDCPPPVRVVYLPGHHDRRHGHYERVIVRNGYGMREVRYIFVEDRHARRDRHDRDCDDERHDRW